MDDKKYGNKNFWCFVPEKWNEKEVAIWKGPEGFEEIIARALNKYEAKMIVDALLNYVYIEDKTKFGKRELAFLEFVKANCAEPYVTMAANAILWNDRPTYENLKNDFPTIYK